MWEELLSYPETLPVHLTQRDLEGPWLLALAAARRGDVSAMEARLEQLQFICTELSIRLTITLTLGLTLTPHASRLTPHASRLAPRASRLSPHASHLTPHASHLTPHA